MSSSKRRSAKKRKRSSAQEKRSPSKKPSAAEPESPEQEAEEEFQEGVELIARKEQPAASHSPRPALKKTALPVARASDKAMPVMEPRPELTWEKEAWEQEEDRERDVLVQERKRPSWRYWFWLAVPVITVAGIWQVVFRSPEADLAADAADAGDKEASEEQSVRLPPTLEEVEELIGAYLQADSVDALVKTIRNPEPLRTTIETHLARAPLKQRTFASLELLVQQDLAGFRYYLAKAAVREGMAEENFLIVDDGDRGWRVDWETQVVFNPVSWQELKAAKPTDEVELRVHAALGTYYNYDFSDKNSHSCIELRDPKGQGVLFAYVGRQTVNGSALIGLLEERGESPVMVRVRYPEKPKSDNQLIVTEVVRFGWLKVPAKKT